MSVRPPEDCRHMKAPCQKGFTVLELMAVTAVVMLMAVAGTVTVRAVRRADISAAASRMSAAIRYTYDTAVLNNGTYRLVIDIASGSWWAERVDTSETCSTTAVLPGEDEEDAEDGDEDRPGLRSGSNPFDGGSMATRMWDMAAIAAGSGEDGGGSGGTLAAAVAEGVASINQKGPSQPASARVEKSDEAREAARELRRQRQRVRDELLKKSDLPSGIQFKAVATGHGDEPVEEGLAEIYFFPSGYVERAYIYLQLGEDVYTIETVPLRGTGVIHKEELDSREVFRKG